MNLRLTAVADPEEAEKSHKKSYFITCGKKALKRAATVLVSFLSGAIYSKHFTLFFFFCIFMDHYYVKQDVQQNFHNS